MDKCRNGSRLGTTWLVQESGALQMCLKLTAVWMLTIPLIQSTWFL